MEDATLRVIGSNEDGRERVPFGVELKTRDGPDGDERERGTVTHDIQRKAPMVQRLDEGHG